MHYSFLRNKREGVFYHHQNHRQKLFICIFAIKNNYREIYKLYKKKRKKTGENKHFDASFSNKAKCHVVHCVTRHLLSFYGELNAIVVDKVKKALVALLIHSI